MKFKNIRAIIFDLDGTLIDSEPIWHEAEIRSFAKVGISLTEEHCLETVGVRIDKVVEYWRARFPWEGVSNIEMVDNICNCVAEIVAEKGSLKAGALSAINYFQERDFPLAVASASPQKLIDTNLRALGIYDKFSIIHSAEHEKAGKPDPAVFLSTAKLLNIPVENCLVFEDSLHGISAAKAAGMFCIAVKESATPFDRACEIADLGISCLEEVFKLEIV